MMMMMGNAEGSSASPPCYRLRKQNVGRWGNAGMRWNFDGAVLKGEQMLYGTICRGGELHGKRGRRPRHVWPLARSWHGTIGIPASRRARNGIVALLGATIIQGLDCTCLALDTNRMAPHNQHLVFSYQDWERCTFRTSTWQPSSPRVSRTSLLARANVSRAGTQSSPS